MKDYPVYYAGPAKTPVRLHRALEVVVVVVVMVVVVVVPPNDNS